MRGTLIRSGVVLGVALLASAAWAQPGRGGFGGGFGQNALTLASIEQVQQELALTDSQKTELASLAEAARGQRGERPNFQNLTEEERAKLREQAAERVKQAREAVAKVLKPEQLERLDQILLQSRGVSALTESEVAGKLKLTDDQSAKLRQLSDERGQAVRAAMQAGDGAREKITALMAESEKQALEVLTAEQREQFAAMKGKPFELPARAGRPGGRRPNNN